MPPESTLATTRASEPQVGRFGSGAHRAWRRDLHLGGVVGKMVICAASLRASAEPRGPAPSSGAAARSSVFGASPRGSALLSRSPATEKRPRRGAASGAGRAGPPRDQILARESHEVPARSPCRCDSEETGCGRSRSEMMARSCGSSLSPSSGACKARSQGGLHRLGLHPRIGGIMSTISGKRLDEPIAQEREAQSHVQRRGVGRGGSCPALSKASAWAREFRSPAPRSRSSDQRVLKPSRSAGSVAEPQGSSHVTPTGAARPTSAP